MILTDNIKKFRLCSDYPKIDIPIFANLISKKSNNPLLIIMIEGPSCDNSIDFNFGYTPANIKIDGTPGSKIRLLNAPYMINLILCGKIHVELDGCLGIKKIHGQRDFPTLEYMSPDSARKLKRIIGCFNRIIGIEDTKLSNDMCSYMSSIPKNKLDIIPHIRSDQTHMKDKPKYKDLMGYKNIIIHVGDDPIDLSPFEIPVLDSLEIRGYLGSDKLVLPTIGVIKSLTIDCCKIKNTFFGNVKEIHNIIIEKLYCIVDEDERPRYSWTHCMVSMLQTIPDVFVNLMPFCDIVCPDLRDSEFDFMICDDTMKLSKDKYIEFLEGGISCQKSAAKI